MRIHSANDRPINSRGEFVLYWMTANRRAGWNYSLDRALEHSRALGKPLIVLEALRSGYRWASDRIHRFVLQGMADNRREFSKTSVRYYAYVESKPGAGSGLIGALASRASVVVTDDFPCFFLPSMVAAVARRVGVAVESVDSNGLLPLLATDRVFGRAYDFRRWLQKNLQPWLEEAPVAEPLRHLKLPVADVPAMITKRWPEATDAELQAHASTLCRLPVDHSVQPACFDGGTQAASDVLRRFVDRRLDRYADHRNDVDQEAASGLSPYLHFGHVSAHEVFHEIAQRELWNPDKLSDSTSGSREGWWGMSRPAESFLDEIVTWRELGYNMCSRRADYDQYESLPEWALKTLAEHAADPREFIYDCAELEQAATHDPLWNAAQRQLVRDGRMHNYMRMLWGKKILEWSESPQQALASMIELNNKYAVDGRNPNSYSGIFWVLGRYDRAWGPQRPVFGKIRYMSSNNTARKLRIKSYLQRYSADGSPPSS